MQGCADAKISQHTRSSDFSFLVTKVSEKLIPFCLRSFVDILYNKLFLGLVMQKEFIIFNNFHLKPSCFVPVRHAISFELFNLSSNYTC